MPEATDATVNLHGTAVSVGGRAVLLRGRPGAGKSDLALRLIGLAAGPLVAHPPMLVADDRVIASRAAAGVRLSCPAALQGLLEVRGIGIVRVPFVATADLALVADLVEPAAIERLPETCSTAGICSQSIPRVLIAPFEASAPLKVMLALARVENHGQESHGPVEARRDTP